MVSEGFWGVQKCLREVSGVLKMISACPKVVQDTSPVPKCLKGITERFQGVSGGLSGASRNYREVFGGARESCRCVSRESR